MIDTEQVDVLTRVEIVQQLRDMAFQLENVVGALDVLNTADDTIYADNLSEALFIVESVQTRMQRDE